MRYFFILLLIPVFAQAQIVGAGKSVDPYKYSIVKEKTYTTVAVSTAHPLASAVGAAVIKEGGNAFDAAIATQLTLAVVYPGAGNLGGGGFLLAMDKKKQMVAIDFREMAPANATRNMYIDSNGNANTDLSQNGHLAAGVPGTVAGLFATLPYAKLPMRILIQPAIDLAENGFVITKNEADNLNGYRAAFKMNNTKTPVFMKATAWKAGDTLVQKDLANTLKRIRDKGAAGFYEGETADLIVAEMQRGKGIITLDDLKNYKAEKRQPLSFNYKGYTIISFPPPSSGGILLWQMMKMIEQRPQMKKGKQTVASVQLMIEAERRAYADRAEHMGDPGFYNVPVKKITSKEYLKQRMADYDSTKASVSKNIGAGKVPESEETTHISIMDKEGNMVAVTTTLNGSYGSKTVVGGAGFLLNNEMDDFSIKPGVPNMYGAVGGEANAIAPGKRMLSSMTPTLVLKNNKPYIVIGTPGGTTIPTSVYQALVNVIDYKMNIADAVNAPKFHHQWLPDEVFVERDFNAPIITKLKKMGYTITPRGGIGRTEAVQIINGKLHAVADKRGDDSVSGF